MDPPDDLNSLTTPNDSGVVPIEITITPGSEYSESDGLMLNNY